MLGKIVISEDGLQEGIVIKQLQFGTEPSVRIRWEDGKDELEFEKNLEKDENGLYKVKD